MRVGKKNNKIIQQRAKLSYTEQIIEVYDKQKEIMHNLCHYLRIIGELALERKSEEIYKIIKELNVELEGNEMTLYSNHIILNALLSEKAMISEKNDVTYEVYVEPEINFGSVKDIDLISMLGNLLENAIHAASECVKEQAGVKIKIFMQNQGNVCVAKIVNDFSGQVHKKNEIFMTTKKDKKLHGIGLRSVRKTAEKYKGHLECYTIKNKFYAILVMPVK